MNGRPLAWLDVFTDAPLAGNGLAVVGEADGLDDAVMLAFARETRLSETTFVQAPTDPRADYRLRIWTPVQEMPLAGHPSLGSAVAVARWQGLEQATFHQQTPAGVQPVTVKLEPDGRASASMLQEPPEWQPPPAAAAVAAAVGLAPADLDARMPLACVSTGYPTVLVAVVHPEAVARARPRYDALAALLPEHPQPNVYVFAFAEEVVHARCFMPSERDEDPATGSAAGPLAAYAQRQLGRETLVIVQGVEMGRPSRLLAAMEGDRPRVSGRAVALADGRIGLPARGRPGEPG